MKGFEWNSGLKLNLLSLMLMDLDSWHLYLPMDPPGSSINVFVEVHILKDLLLN